MTALVTLLTGRCTVQPVSLGPIMWIVKLRDFERAFLKFAFDPYHPERHYMRGPGPACAAKAAALNS
ncbi:MAG: hypothetical protein AB1342_08695 [Pseudomonadota bacterium]